MPDECKRHGRVNLCPIDLLCGKCCWAFTLGSEKENDTHVKTGRKSLCRKNTAGFSSNGFFQNPHSITLRSASPIVPPACTSCMYCFLDIYFPDITEMSRTNKRELEVQLPPWSYQHPSMR